MNDSTKMENLMREYRERTSIPSPQGLQGRVLARLQEAALAYPLSLSLGAVVSTAGLAAIFTVSMSFAGVRHKAEIPPSFLEEVPSSAWFLNP